VTPFPAPVKCTIGTVTPRPETRRPEIGRRGGVHPVRKLHCDIAGATPRCAQPGCEPARLDLDVTKVACERGARRNAQGDPAPGLACSPRAIRITQVACVHPPFVTYVCQLRPGIFVMPPRRTSPRPIRRAMRSPSQRMCNTHMRMDEVSTSNGRRPGERQPSTVRLPPRQCSFTGDDGQLEKALDGAEGATYQRVITGAGDRAFVSAVRRPQGLRRTAQPSWTRLTLRSGVALSSIGIAGFSTPTIAAPERHALGGGAVAGPPTIRPGRRKSKSRLQSGERVRSFRHWEAPSGLVALVGLTARRVCCLHGTVADAARSAADRLVTRCYAASL